jgi:hypothetical protein
MTPFLTAALPIFGNLLGGAMQNKSAKNAAKAQQAASEAAALQERTWAIDDQAEQFVRLRAAAEKAGFNPLTALGAAPNSGMVNPTSASSASGVSAQNYMGEAIATSSLMLADSMSKTNAAATGKKLQNANRANAALSSKLTAATLRPKMAGVFDRPSKFGIGSNGQVSTPRVANSGSHGSPSWLYDLTPLPTVDPADPRRTVVDKPIETHAGVMVIDSPWFGRTYIPTLDGDEALQWYDYPSLALPAAQWAWNRAVPAVKQSWNEHRAAVQKRNENWRLQYEAQPKPKPQGAKANFLLGNK